MIIEKVKKTLLGGIERFAKEASLTDDRVQLLIMVKPDGELVYSEAHDYRVVREVQYKQIKNVKIDLMGEGEIVGSFILKYLANLASQKNLEITRVSAMICKHQGQIRIFEYNDSNFVKELTLKEIIET